MNGDSSGNLGQGRQQKEMRPQRYAGEPGKGRPLEEKEREFKFDTEDDGKPMKGNKEGLDTTAHPRSQMVDCILDGMKGAR